MYDSLVTTVSVSDLILADCLENRWFHCFLEPFFHPGDIFISHCSSLVRRSKAPSQCYFPVNHRLLSLVAALPFFLIPCFVLSPIFPASVYSFIGLLLC